MGGIVALTIRFSETECYRGSCHTNVLPDGLCVAPFYVDLPTSKVHTQAWLTQILDGRREDEQLELLWGGHNMLAPIEYGIVIIDYVTSTFVSAQGYSNLCGIFSFEGEHSERWHGLVEAQLLGDKRSNAHFEIWDIKMPFATVKNGHEGIITPELMAWCDATFGLSDAEKAVWTQWFKERSE